MPSEYLHYSKAFALSTAPHYRGILSLVLDTKARADAASIKDLLYILNEQNQI